MFRHLVIAALRNLSANRLQSAIAIIGLSIGIASALLMALVIRNQTTYDHFIPGHERTYIMVSKSLTPGRPDRYGDTGQINMAEQLKLLVPQIQSVTRLVPVRTAGTGVNSIKISHGQITAEEPLYWADPNVFEVLPLPVYRGDLTNALKQADGIVIPRSIARKYFGRDDAVGQIIQVNDHPMTVRAVIEDLPVNGTSLKASIFASGLASFSTLATFKVQPNLIQFNTSTYFRLKSATDISAVERQLPKLADQQNSFANQPGKPPGYILQPVLLDQLPLHDGLYPGAQTRLSIAALVGALILFIASVNFVNLLTARAARRALEVGVRKVCGAARRLLVLQFLGESILTVFFATCLAVALTEWILPSANVFLQTGAALDYWQEPQTLVLLLAGAVVLGIVSGAYPAFVLSSFRPAGVLKGLVRYSRGTGMVRNALVVLQFAILISLVVASTVIYQQHLYATRDGLRGNIDQMVIVRQGCTPAFLSELQKLPGIAGVSCSSQVLVQGQLATFVMLKGERVILNISPVAADLFALYGIAPIAGSLPAKTAQDNTPAPTAAPAEPQGPFASISSIILNEAAVKRLGFKSPQAAIGQTAPAFGPGGAKPIIAVVPDFSYQSVDDVIPPMAYTISPIGQGLGMVSIKLKGQQIPETLTGIDRIWTATHPGMTISRFFLDDHIQELYLKLLRQAQSLAIFSGVAVFLACLGLLGLSIATAERRTKEIGIRKAMGAGSADVTRLLLWQFAKPVLWANLIAWPIAFYAMNRWLSGFAYHVALNPLDFVGATLLAILVALLTVAVQSTLASRAVPATSLRYE